MGMFGRSRAAEGGRKQVKYGRLAAAEGEAEAASTAGRRTYGGYCEEHVRSALDMAQLALASVRRRAEALEGEAALLEVQLQDNARQAQREREKRARAERELATKAKDVAALQRAVADGVVANRKLEKRADEAAGALEGTQAQLQRARGDLASRDAAVKQLEERNRQLAAKLEQVAGDKKRLEQQVAAERQEQQQARHGGFGDLLGGGNDNVSSAAAQLARALTQITEGPGGLGGLGLETDATATASAALHLAQALGSAAHGAGRPDEAPLAVAAPVTPPPAHAAEAEAAGQENVHPGAGLGLVNLLSSAKADRAYMTAPERRRRASSSGVPTHQQHKHKPTPLGNSAKANQAVGGGSRSAASSPWPAPLSATLGQFLSWTSATKKNVTTTANTSSDTPSSVTSCSAHPFAAEQEVEYSVTSYITSE